MKFEFPDLTGADAIALDTETTGLRPDRDEMFGLCVAASFPGPRRADGEPRIQGWYFDIRETPEALPWLTESLEDTSRTPLVFHNAPFDCRFLNKYIPMFDHLDRVEDTGIIARCLNEQLGSYSLDALAERWLGERKEADIYPQLAELFGGPATRGSQMKNLHRAPAEIVAPYGIKDAELTLRLWHWQLGVIEEHPELYEIYEFERCLIPTFITLCDQGVAVDTERARDAMDRLEAEVYRAHDRINELVGREVNVNSAPQVKSLWEFKESDFGDPKEFHVDVANGRVWVDKTSTGNPSVTAETLHSMADMGDEVAAQILDLRSLIKTRGTFLEKHILGHEHGGRIRPDIRQFGTTTGRLAVSSPALQQIPSRNKSAAEIVKRCFLPNKGQVWLDSDLSSFEVRVFAGLVKDPGILQAYRDDPETDFHQYVADLTGLPRNPTRAGEANAKQLNLSMIFNSGNGSIADKMGMKWEWAEFIDEEDEEVRYKKAGREAMDVIDTYHSALPGVKKLAHQCSNEAIKYGYVKTHYGRKIRFPDKRFAYKASGLLIQATAADMNKIAVRVMQESAAFYGGQLLLNTHDSYSVSLPQRKIEKFWALAQSRLDKEFEWFPVPLILELTGVGHSWWGALINELGVEL